MPLEGPTVTIEITGYKDAQRLAAAVALLRSYGMAHGDEAVIKFAEDAEKSLQNLDVTTEHRL